MREVPGRRGDNISPRLCTAPAPPGLPAVSCFAPPQVGFRWTVCEAHGCLASSRVLVSHPCSFIGIYAEELTS